ncbi:TPA: helix-turn-helix domain-containing protein [Serratia liquefaciens]|uniref:helix-turn-helix transcriptional regulator n=1 Tax=Yersinia mollaretii TaxID=33060 RepID=UPI000C1E5771|nr:helix-turn-helix domain-containing protein [Yersinia mollaretii]EMB6556425.1 helix-turn-helix domain-containing protein [Yersinia enterocolitica]PJE89636.1 DNA-binding protein [Yersinia mollaretii]
MSIYEQSKTPLSELVSTGELAHLLNLKAQTIRKWLCQDKLPNGLPRPKKINSRHYWLRKDIDRFLLTFSAYCN